MRLICEVNEIVTPEVLVESTSTGLKNYYINGIFLQANIENRNGRVYPLPILETEVARYNQAYVNQNRALGELGHPDGPTINMERSSHLIKELYRDGNNFIGKAKILDTPMGRIVKTLIDDGVKLGVSSRGMGSLKENTNGIQEVQDDFYLATAADIVADPSAPAAFVHGIMEGKSWDFVGGILTERTVSKLRKKAHTVTSAKRDALMLEAWTTLLKRIH